MRREGLPLDGRRASVGLVAVTRESGAKASIDNSVDSGGVLDGDRSCGYPEFWVVSNLTTGYAMGIAAFACRRLDSIVNGGGDYSFVVVARTGCRAVALSA
ncbi:hypothetical protein [Mycetohabitans sp. B46]|uniref:hypothetical protein n=1 Tax=Mycetohabitans sp. B46 TaxID=2772536 RepID=UPI00307DD33F